jgi:hypothetical protein
MPNPPTWSFDPRGRCQYPLFGAFALTFNLNFSGHSAGPAPLVPLGWVDSKPEMVRRIQYIRHKAAI